MRKQTLLISAALALAALLCGCAARADTPETAATPTPMVIAVETPAPPAEERAAAVTVSLRLAADRDHPALMRCDGNGSFYPERTVTRAVFCAYLAPLLTGLPEAPAEAFTDYRMGNADYAAAASLQAAGLVSADGQGAFRPRAELTRGELIFTLTRLAEALPVRAAERAGTLAADAAAGALSPYGEAGEETPVTREELAVVLERLMGREPNEAGLLLEERLPEDIALDDHAWAYIADAVTAGRVETPAPGVHRAYGTLYAVWEDGTLVRDMDLGVWTFGQDGRYTTGSQELDGYIARALEESGANDLTGREALEAAYLYVKNYGVYLVRPEDMEALDNGALGWEYAYALRFFRYGGGTCYGYAAAFGLLARALGETAYIVSAEVNQYHGAHSFVVIPEEGVDYLYDPELEATRPERHGDLALFRITNFSVYSYWYDPDWA